MDAQQEKAKRSNKKIWDLVEKAWDDHPLFGKSAKQNAAPTSDTTSEDLSMVEKNEQVIKLFTEFKIYDDLEKLGDNEIERQHADLIKKQKAKKEKTFLEQHQLRADLDEWVKMPYWNHKEAIALIHGLHPDKLQAIDNLNPELDIIHSYLQGLIIVSRAIEVKDLSLKPRPSQFVSWAISNNLHVDPRLISWLDKITESELPSTTLNNQAPVSEDINPNAANTTHDDMPMELKTAIKLWRALYINNEKPDHLTHTIAATHWLKDNINDFKNMPTNQKDRIIRVCTPDNKKSNPY